MDSDRLKKVLAGLSIAGLLTGAAVPVSAQAGSSGSGTKGAGGTKEEVKPGQTS